MKSWERVMAEPGPALPEQHLVDVMAWILAELDKQTVTREQQKAVEVAQHVMVLARAGRGMEFVERRRADCRRAFVAAGLTIFVGEDERLEGDMAKAVAEQVFGGFA